MAKQIIATFSITISGQENNFSIEASGPGRIRVDPHAFVWQPTPQQQRTLDLLEENPGRVVLDQLIDLGQVMYQSIFSPAMAIAFGRAQQSLKRDAGMRIRLQIAPPELAHLPWELMHDDRDFIALRSNYPIVRGIGDSLISHHTTVRGRLKILYAWANPEDQLPLRLQEPAQAIGELLSDNNRIEYTVRGNATLERLRSDLLDDYHILCFAGHGTHEHIYLESEQGHQKVSAQTLARELEGKSTKLVFLAACETSKFAQSLAAQAEIPAVVAMQYEVDDEEANHLTARFFETLAALRPVDAALSEARKSIIDENRMVRDVFAPMLYLQSESSHVFRHSRNLLALSFAIAFMIAVVIGIFAFTKESGARIEQQRYREAISLAEFATENIDKPDSDIAVIAAAKSLRDYPYTWQAEQALWRAIVSDRAHRVYKDFPPGNVQWLPGGIVVDSSTRSFGFDIYEISIFEPEEDRFYLIQENELLYVSPGESGKVAFFDGVYPESIKLVITDMTTGEVLSQFSSFPFDEWRFPRLLWSPNGEYLVIINDITNKDVSELAVLDVENNVLLDAPDGELTDVRFIGEDSRLAMREGNSTFKIWDIASSRFVSSSTFSWSEVPNTISISPNGNYILLAQDTSLFLYSFVNSIDPLARIETQEPTYSISWAPDSSRFATENSIYSIDGTKLFSIQGSNLRWSPSGKLLLTINEAVYIYDGFTGQLVTEIGEPNDQISSADWSPDEQKIVTSGSLYTKIWNLQHHMLRTSIDGIQSACWPPNSDEQLAINTDEQRLVIVSLDTGREIKDLGSSVDMQNQYRSGLVWSSDGNLIAAHSELELMVWDINSPTPSTIVPIGNISTFDVEWSPVSPSSLAISQWGDVFIWDYVENTKRTLPAFDMTVDIDWSPDGTYLAIADKRFRSGYYSYVHIIDINQSELVETIAEGASIKNISWSPVNDLVVVNRGGGSYAQIIEVRDIWKDKILFTIYPNTEINSVAWSPEGNRIALGGNGEIEIWDLESGQQLVTIESSSSIQNLEWSSNGKWLLALTENQLQVWRVFQDYTELLQYAENCCVNRELSSEELEMLD